jgi:hypothetical protein
MDLPKLSTMVILYNLNVKLNTSILLEQLALDDKIIKVEKKGFLTRGTSLRDKVKKRSKKTKENATGFGRNSITVVSLNDGEGTLPLKEITTKIFQNGVFHMTGVLDPGYDSSTLNYLMSKIWAIPESLTNSPAEWKVEKRRVVLMNYVTELSPKATVARETLTNNIKALKDSQIVASYDPDVYPGVKIQFVDRKWTAKIFRTGKMILTGVVSPEDCLQFTMELNSLLKKTLIK